MDVFAVVENIKPRCLPLSEIAEKYLSLHKFGDTPPRGSPADRQIRGW
jgi:hypothetical protein